MDKRAGPSRLLGCNPGVQRGREGGSTQDSLEQSKMSSQDLAAKKDKHKEFYRLDKDPEGLEMFACNLFENKCRTVEGMKRHITTIHKDQTKVGEPEPETEVPEDDMDVSLDETRLAQLQKDMEDAERVAEENADRVVEENHEDTADTRLIIDNVTEQLGTLPEAVERIKGLVEEMGVKEEVIRKLETELTTARDLANIANSEKDAFAIENDSLKEEIKSAKSQAINSRKLIKHQMGGNCKCVNYKCANLKDVKI